jgi:hypothetical protein
MSPCLLRKLGSTIAIEGGSDVTAGPDDVEAQPLDSHIPSTENKRTLNKLKPRAIEWRTMKSSFVDP